MTNEQRAKELLAAYRVGGHELFLIGTFDTGVTVFSQQLRALNLAWALIESGALPTVNPSAPSRRNPRSVAVVGAGFAGLTFAAALIAKQADVQITIFEKRDTLLPLQQGSDSRWLHPRIYDWPGEGSESSVAMLPVLNWGAARASDVVVEILRSWKKLLSSSPGVEKPSLFCNSRHLQVHRGGTAGELRIEWIGEPRDPVDGTSRNGGLTAIGRSEAFQTVVLAVGFGLEREGALSYWRNENHGQPSLDRPRRALLVSGQGDGAMIDLLRLRISQFRQDRILEELFAGKPALLQAVKRLHGDFGGSSTKSGLFHELEGLEGHATTRDQFQALTVDLSRRLRRDTDVILRLQVPKLSELFEPSTARISFQNKLLVFLLYKCGGFVPTNEKEEEILKYHSIQPEDIVRRHGTHRDEQLRSLLAPELCAEIYAKREGVSPDPFTQSDKPEWPGGYFGTPGRSDYARQVEQGQRASWRKEYLPGPTQILATSFCAGVAGWLRVSSDPASRLRIVLHRTLPFGTEVLLQQSCEYQGVGIQEGHRSTAGRTFPAENATIGLAYRSRGIIHSVYPCDAEELGKVMGQLNLEEASRTMSKEVHFVAAVPLIDPGSHSEWATPNGVCGVLYIDSTDPKFALEEGGMNKLRYMCEQFLESLTHNTGLSADRIRNVPLTRRAPEYRPAVDVPEFARHVLLRSDIPAPQSPTPLLLNFDFSDFLVIQ